jgi:hypothetical protein
MIKISIKRKVKFKMGKKIAKLIGKNNEFKYFTPGVYIGKYRDYDITIKFDSASLLYNMSFSVSGNDSIDKLNKNLAKIDKYAVARYKNNNLTISEACDSIKEMPTLINKILDIIIDYLISNKYTNVCSICGKNNETNLISLDGNVTYYCDKCFNLAHKKYQNQIDDNKKIKENVFLGIIGAIIGSIPGIITFFLLSYLKINSSFAALIIMLGSAYGYKWLANSMKTFGLIISLIIGFASIIIANEMCISYSLYLEYSNLYNINVYDAYKAIPYYLSNSASFKSNYIQNLLVAIIFGIFGGLSNFGIYRKYTANNKIIKVGDKNE